MIKLEMMMRDAFYSKVDPRRRQEIADARLIQEDPRAMANLPTQGFQRQYNQDRFRYDQNSAGSPNWERSEVDETLRDKMNDRFMSAAAKSKYEAD
jgi:hypothetical protein